MVNSTGTADNQIDRIITDDIGSYVINLYRSQHQPQKIIYDFLRSKNKHSRIATQNLDDSIDLETLSFMLIRSNRKFINRGVQSASTKKNKIAQTIMFYYRNNFFRKDYINTVFFFGGKCCYCQNPLNPIRNDAYGASIDHANPTINTHTSEISGGYRYGNLLICCRKCNSNKRSLTVEEWLNHLEPTISPKTCHDSLERIAAFQKAVNYQDFTKPELTIVQNHVNDLDEHHTEFSRSYLKEEAKKLEILTKDVQSQ